VANAS
jgi:glutamate decarboxylase